MNEVECPRCGERALVKSEYDHIEVSHFCFGNESRIYPHGSTPTPLTLEQVVERIAAQFPRDYHSGECRFCNTGMYQNGSFADTHADDCPWLSAVIWLEKRHS